jgi:ABC-2 type transport system permease protein
MTYVSGTMRAALVPSVPHIQPWVCLLVLAGSLTVLRAIGVRGFYRCAID